MELATMMKSGDILDVGAGNGRNSFYLASQGFKVTALEPDPGSLIKLRAKNKESVDKVTLVPTNIQNFQTPKRFDAVISNVALHFLPALAIFPAIQKIQKLTKKGGYNLITAYTDKNPPETRPYLFRHNELRSYYDGWDIVIYEERPAPTKQDAVYLIARKPIQRSSDYKTGIA